MYLARCPQPYPALVFSIAYVISRVYTWSRSDLLLTTPALGQLVVAAGERQRPAPVPAAATLEREEGWRMRKSSLTAA